MLRLFINALLFLSCITSCKEKTNLKIKQNGVSSINAKQQAASTQKADNSDFKSNITTTIDPGVLCILQDKNDHYWFGTNGGAYRYDGNSVIVFTEHDGLFQNQVQEIQEDASGNIWFGTGGYGVSRFDGKHISTLSLKENTLPNTAKEKNWITRPGDLWFCAGGGAFKCDGESFTYLPFPKPDIDEKYKPNPPYRASAYGVYATLKDRNGNLWFGTQSMGVCRFDGKSFTWFTEKGLRGPAVLALFEDANSNLWFGTNGNGIFRYDGKTLTNFTEEKGLDNPEFRKSGKSGPGTLARVWAINEDNLGNLWMGTGDAGAWCYDGTNLIQYTEKDGLPNRAIETIYKDKKGELWFGTNGAGIYRLAGQTFEKFNP